MSPRDAATGITILVLLIHGAADVDTAPEHSERVLAALKGEKRFIRVAGAGHNGSLRVDVWQEIERWIDAVLAR